METPFAAQRKLSFWQIRQPPTSGQGHGDDVARIWRPKGHMRLPLPPVGKDRHEQTLAGEQALACAKQLVHEPTAPARAGCIAENGLHLYGAVFVHHGAGLCDGALSRIEFDFHELHLGPENLEIDLIGRSRPRRRRFDPRRRRLIQFRHLADGHPLGKPLSPRITVGILLGLGRRLGMVQRPDLPAFIA